MTGEAPGTRAKLTIDELYQRAEKADQLAGIYQQALADHRKTARDAARTAANCERLAGQVRSELEWLAVALKDMADDALRRKLEQIK